MRIVEVSCYVILRTYGHGANTSLKCVYLPPKDTEDLVCFAPWVCVHNKTCPACFSATYMYINSLTTLHTHNM